MKTLFRFAPVLVAVLAACASSSTSPVAPLPGTGGGPPASLAAITPAPGLPTLVPGSTAIVAASPGAPVLGSETLPPYSPAPAPSGSDLASLVAGKAPSAAYFASLSAPYDDAIAALGTTGAPRAIFGTVANFSNDGFTIHVAHSDLSGELRSGAAYAAETLAAGASDVVVHVSKTTIDVVPGGFAALRVALPVLVAGSGPASDFIAAAVVADPSAESASSSADDVSAARAATRPVGTRRNAARRRDSGSGVREQTEFALTRSVGIPGNTIPNPPFMTPPIALGCVNAVFSAFITYGLGQTANYPMLLQDVSDPTSYVEGQSQSLPVRLVDAPATGLRTYFVNYGLAENVGVTFDLTPCFSGGASKPPTVKYPLSLVTIGQALEADSTDPMPATGNMVTATANSCPFIPFTGFAVFTLVVNFPTPSISACFDFQLTGAQIKGSATITNATLLSVDESGLSSNLLSDTSWLYQSDLPVGDPNVTLVPNASPTDGSMQDNVVSLSAMNTDLTAVSVPNIKFCAVLSLCLTLGGAEFGVQSASVFETQIHEPAIGLEQPSPVTLTLMPSDGEVPITLK